MARQTKADQKDKLLSDSQVERNIKKWQDDKTSEISEDSPITVGIMQSHAYKQHEDFERDKNPSFPEPFAAQKLFTGQPGSDNHAGVPIPPQARYDPIGYPETGREPGPPSYTNVPSMRRDPLNFGGASGFTDDPTSLGRRYAGPDQLIGPDGVRDQLRDFEINARIQMGDMPMHRGMPSPIPPTAHNTDIRGPPRNLNGGGNQFFYHEG